MAPVEVLGWVRGGAGASAGSGRVGLSAGGGSLRPSWAARHARVARGGRRPESAVFAILRVWWCRDAASVCALERVASGICSVYIEHALLQRAHSRAWFRWVILGLEKTDLVRYEG